MRVLILSVTAGEGHNAQGRALINELNERGYISEMHDYYKGIDNIRAKFANEIYFWALKKFPKFGHNSYVKINNRDVTKEAPKFCTFSIMLNSKKCIKKVEEKINEFKPDFIFATHVYTAVLMSRFKKQNKYKDIPVFFTVNDYVTHAYTENATNIEYVLTPNEDFNERLFEMGFKKEQLLPLGIVVDTKFSINKDKNTIRKNLGFALNKPIIYLSSGGIGFGNTLETITKLDELSEEFEIIVVNAHNKKMFDKINDYINLNPKHKIHNYAFVNNVDELMSASDVMIGKIGGTSLMESFNIGLPIICMGTPPFQECDNLQYLLERNAIIHTLDNEDTKNKIKELINNPKILEEIKNNISKLAKPNCTKDFVDLMEKLYKK